MNINVLILAIMAFYHYDASCAIAWFDKSRVYVSNEESPDSLVNEVASENEVGEKKKKSFTGMSWPLRNFQFKRQNNVQIVPTDGNETDSVSDQRSKYSNVSPRLLDVERLESDAFILTKKAAQIEEQRRAVERALMFAREDEAAKIFKQSRNMDVQKNDFEGQMYAAKRAAFKSNRAEDLRIATIPRKAAAARCYLNKECRQCDNQPGCAWRGFPLNRCDVDCTSLSDEQTCHMTVGIINNDGINPNYSARDTDEKLSEFVDENYSGNKICIFMRKKGCTWRNSRSRL